MKKARTHDLALTATSAAKLLNADKIESLAKDYWERSVKLETIIYDLGEIVARLRVTGETLQREDADLLKPGEPEPEDPVHLNGCYLIITQAAQDIVEVIRKSFEVLPSINCFPPDNYHLVAAWPSSEFPREKVAAAAEK